MTGIPYEMEDIAKIAGGSFHPSRNVPATIGRIAFDTRKIFEASDTLFVAIRGEQRDGHDFIENAISRGVRNFLVVHVVPASVPVNFVVVKDTIAALRTLAAHHRKRFHYPVIAITGSNGKTITKEWLSELLSEKSRVVKSPRSYNSQLGVALSVLGMGANHDFAIIEAGISRTGEMQNLQEVIRPDVGILTHFADAHDEGFAGREAKLKEKLKLFSSCRVVIVSSDDSLVLDAMRQAGLAIFTVGYSESADMKFSPGKENGGYHVKTEGEEVSLFFRHEGDSSMRNMMLSVCAARNLGMDFDSIQTGLRSVSPISMRTQLITENPEVTILNDAWNSDVASIHNAYSLLESEFGHVSKKIILTDMDQQGDRQVEVQEQVLSEACRRFGGSSMIVIGKTFQAMASSYSGVRSYVDTESLLADFKYSDFKGHVVLLKGSRSFQLELLIPHLGRGTHSTQFTIHLDVLASNLRSLQRLLPEKTKVMAMVKAFAYGSGSWEVASALSRAGADYFAVAFVSEGIQLRSSNINTPAMVMSADDDSCEQLYQFHLEPEVFHLSFLKKYIAAGERMKQPVFPIHIKLDTGMHRLGFSGGDIPELLKMILKYPKIEVKSIFTHLAAADDPAHDRESREQVRIFEEFYDQISATLSVRPLKHILNTAGIIRFPEYAFDMVRPGIGIYGIAERSATGGIVEETGSLRTVITQICRYPAGTAIGYGMSQVTKRETLIATIPIGYADGLLRILGNGRISFLVREKSSPTFGKICMDMTMIDVTEIPEVQEGDEVVIFGRQGRVFQSVKALSDAAGTIPYEILSRISERVRRIYISE